MDFKMIWRNWFPQWVQVPFESLIWEGQVYASRSRELDKLFPSEELSAIFLKFEIVVCKIFDFGKV